MTTQVDLGKLGIRKNTRAKDIWQNQELDLSANYTVATSGMVSFCCGLCDSWTLWVRTEIHHAQWGPFSWAPVIVNIESVFAQNVLPTTCDSPRKDSVRGKNILV